MQIVTGTQLKAFIKVLGSNYEVLKTLGLNYEEREDGGAEIINLVKWSSSPNGLSISTAIFVFLSEQYQKTVSTLAIPHQTTKFTNINSDSYKGKHKGTKNRTSARHQYTKFLKCKKTSSLTYLVSSYVKMQTNHFLIRTFN